MKQGLDIYTTYWHYPTPNQCEYLCQLTPKEQGIGSKYHQKKVSDMLELLGSRVQYLDIDTSKFLLAAQDSMML